MTRFEQAIPWVLDHEGGFVDHPKDPGGATNWGISLRFLRKIEGKNIAAWDLDGDGDVDADDIYLLTRDQAIELYRQHFWHSYLDHLSSPVIATKLFDMMVNMGQRQAVRIFQRSLALFDHRINVDGFLGNQTVMAESRLITDGGFSHLVEDLGCQQAKFYYELVESREDRDVFLFGWLRRAYSFPM